MDFLPDRERRKDPQWEIGFNNLLISSLGAIPSKDNFWSSSNKEEPCHWPGYCVERNSELQALVSVLSGGVVAFSDKIGFANRTRLMRTCREDGVILKADTPATTVDAVFSTDLLAFVVDNPPPPLSTAEYEFQSLPNAWSSSSELDGYKWYFVFAANLSYLIDADVVDTPGEYVVENWYSGELFNYSGSLELPAMTAKANLIPFQFFTLSPILPGGWIVLGESDKFIKMSKQRIKELSLNPLQIELEGAVGEEVVFDILHPQNGKLRVFCVMSNTGSGIIKCLDSGCKCL